MALLHNNRRVLKPWNSYAFQKFYKKWSYTKNMHTRIWIQKTMFLSPFRLYKTQKWKTVKTMKQLNFFQSFKKQWNSSIDAVISWETSLSKGVSKQQCFWPTAQYELCTHIKIHCPIQILVLPNLMALVKTSAQLLRTSDRLSGNKLV